MELLSEDLRLALQWFNSGEDFDETVSEPSGQCNTSIDTNVYEVWASEPTIVPRGSVGTVYCNLSEPQLGVGVKSVLSCSLCASLISDEGSQNAFRVLDGVQQVDEGPISVLVANANSEPLIIPALTKVAVASEVEVTEQILLDCSDGGYEVSVHQIFVDHRRDEVPSAVLHECSDVNGSPSSKPR